MWKFIYLCICFCNENIIWSFWDTWFIVQFWPYNHSMLSYMYIYRNNLGPVIPLCKEVFYFFSVSSCHGFFIGSWSWMILIRSVSWASKYCSAVCWQADISEADGRCCASLSSDSSVAYFTSALPWISLMILSSEILYTQNMIPNRQLPLLALCGWISHHSLWLEV